MTLLWVAELVDDDTKDTLDSIIVGAPDRESALQMAREQYRQTGVIAHYTYRRYDPVIWISRLNGK